MGTDDLNRIGLSARLSLRKLAVLLKKTLKLCTHLLELLSNFFNYLASTFNFEFGVFAVMPWVDW